MRRIARAGVLVAACAATAAIVLFCTREERRGSGEAVAAVVAPLADSYLRNAREQGDEKALDEVQKTDQDPWVLAEELLVLDQRDAAARVAHARLAEDEAVLQAYIARTKPPRDLAGHLATATRLLEQGRPADALERLGNDDPTGLTVTHAQSTHLRAQALDAMGRHDEATEAWRRLVNQAFAIGWRRGEVAARVGLLERLGQDHQDEQRDLLKGLVGPDSDARDVTRSASWCGRLGRLEASARGGDLRLARRWLLEADELYGAAEQTTGLSSGALSDRVGVLAALSAMHQSLGNPALAFAAATRAYGATRGSSGISVELRQEAAMRLAHANHSLGRFKQAASLMQEAVDANTGEPRRQVPLLGELARLRLEMGDYDGAKEAYARVRNSQVVRDNPRLLITTDQHLAAAVLDAPPDKVTVADLQEALSLLSMDDRIRRIPEEERPLYAESARALRGRALTRLGRPAVAVEPLQQAMGSRYARDNPQFATNVSVDLARALRRSGDGVRALACATDAIRVLEAEIARTPASLALSRLRATPELVDEFVACSLEAEDAGGTLEALERTRGMVFLVEAARRRAEGAGPPGSSVPTEASVMAAEVGAAAQAYGRARVEGKRDRIADARELLWKRRIAVRTVRDSADAEKADRNPSEVAIRLPAGDALEAGEAMLYLGSYGEKAIAVLARDGGVERFILAPRADYERDLAAARTAWLAADAQKAPAALSRLSAAVLPPTLIARIRPSQRGKVKHLYVSVAGPGARLPWAPVVESALRDAGVETESVPTVSLVSSQRVLRSLRAWNVASAGGHLLAIGNPDVSPQEESPAGAVLFGTRLGDLPASEAEVRRIVDPSRGDVLLLGRDADEKTLRRNIFEHETPFQILHFACHGNLYGEVPEWSALALHRSGGDDGLLTLEEISDWRFPGGPRLVVLAACESGLGVPTPGEGEEGFVRALLQAGARHVVATLWSVPDEASGRIMTAFHRNMRDRGLAPAAALRAAQAEVREGAGAALPPRAWAGWQVWGPQN